MISGANRGIGLAMTRKLHGLGYCVSAGSRNLDALQVALGDLASDRVFLHRYDALDSALCSEWVESTAARWGRIDGLVNNAGIWLPVGIEDDDDESYDQMWAINVKAPLRMIRLTLPYLKRAGSGRIINIASLSGKRVRGSAAGYSMAKFAVAALTHSARRAGWEHGIRATAICPGWVDTDMAAEIGAVPKNEMTSPDDLAELVATMLALPNSAVVAELLVNSRLEDML